MSDTKLHSCETCKPDGDWTPVSVSNKPGLSALAYRVGTHGRFKKSQLSRIAKYPGLNPLKTRDDDDPSIALADAWATALDVITFYQERIANEGFLRTAIESRSVHEMANAIGYVPRAGLAASAYLAFRMETTPGAPAQAVVGIGTKSQSIPEQDQTPQMFETIEGITARREWNELKPLRSSVQLFAVDNGNLFHAASGTHATVLYIDGIAADIKAGDMLLVDLGSGKSPRALALRVRSAEIQADEKRIRVELDTAAAADIPGSGQTGSGTNVAAAKLTESGNARFPLNETNADKFLFSTPWRETDLQNFIKQNNWNPDDVQTLLGKLKIEADKSGLPEIFIFREQCGFFGSNAPGYDSLRNARGRHLYPANWDNPGWSIWQDYPSKKAFNELWPADAFLDRKIPGVVKGGKAVFTSSQLPAAAPEIYQIVGVTEASLVGFGMSGKTTGLLLTNLAGASADKTKAFSMRNTTAYVRSEPLVPAALPVEEAIPAAAVSLELDTLVFGFAPKQLCILSGEDADAPGVMRSEILCLDDAVHFKGLTTLHFHAEGSTNGLAHSYVRKTVSINANVARATHGESKKEVLGSGDGSKAWQSFMLKQAPLTHVSAPTASGLASTLEIRANDILWNETRDFYRLPGTSSMYTAREGDDGKTTVQFGDGKNGARLPSGMENVTAAYRVGHGVAGMVKAGQISLLLSRPPGLKEVTNPLAASGGADPESAARTRQNAPLTVCTLDRIVSLRDYEDFAQAFAGIAKAQAVWLWNGEKKIVHLTVAGEEGTIVESSSQLGKNLKAAIRGLSSPGQQVRIDSYQPRTFDVKAKLLIRTGYIGSLVLQNAMAALSDRYSFESGLLARSIAPSDILALLQSVEGVEAVDLDYFYFTFGAVTREDILPARSARWDEAGQNILGAELLLLDTNGSTLTEMSI